MRTSEVLNRAADLIEERGWARTEGWNGQPGTGGRLCLEGGIMAALEIPYFLSGDPGTDTIKDVLRPCPAYVAVRDYLEMSEDGYLYHFNDANGRTASEVIEVLRATALVEAAKENSKIEETA